MSQATTLVPVFTGILQNQLVHLCDARALHALLEVGRDFANWIKERIAQYGFIEGEDFSPKRAKRTGGRPLVDYHLTLDMAKELAMVEKTEKGRQARRYFIECERRLKSAVPPAPTFHPMQDKLNTSRFLMHFDNQGRAQLHEVAHGIQLIDPANAEHLRNFIAGPLPTDKLPTVMEAMSRRVGAHLSALLRQPPEPRPKPVTPAPAESLPVSVANYLRAQYQHGDKVRLAKELGVHTETADRILRRLHAS